MNMTVKLLSGHQMPIIGLGTYKMQGYETLLKALDTALAAGYRSIDTASVYRNETDIGKALKILLPKYKLERKDIFITSKLGPSEQGKGSAMAALTGSIQRLDCDYLDLYLIHWPGTSKFQPGDERHKQLRKESWQDMEQALKQGKLKSLGISNYLSKHIEELLSYCTVKPSVLQTEYHPHLIQADVKATCDKHNIHLQAYSSLGTTTSSNQLLSDPIVIEIAQQCKKSPAQILLHWAVHQGIGVLPKSTNPNHIKDNMDIFSFNLSDDQMNILFHLNKQMHYCWDPKDIA